MQSEKGDAEKNFQAPTRSTVLITWTFLLSSLGIAIVSLMMRKFSCNIRKQSTLSVTSAIKKWEDSSGIESN